MNENQEESKIRPLGMFVLSFDNLCFTKIDQSLNTRWSIHPPLFKEYGNKADKRDTLKAMCRKGVPPALRQAIWITSVIRIAQPHLSIKEVYEYGTLSKATIMDHGYDTVLSTLFSDKTDAAAIKLPNFGLSEQHMKDLLERDYGIKGGCIPEKGVNSLTRVLYVFKNHLDIEFCPLLPDLTAILLSVMPESCAFATIREMLKDHSYFFPISRSQQKAWCKTFSYLMKKLYPSTTKALIKNGVLTQANGLDPIFQRFFIPILKKDHVLRIMDIYFIEGFKAFYRIGAALLCLCHDLGLKDSKNWWESVRKHTHSVNFKNSDFEGLLQKSYGLQGEGLKKKLIFPRRQTILRLIKKNENLANPKESDSESDLSEGIPLGYVEGEVPIVLAKDTSVRLAIAEFLPFSFKNTKLELIHSTNAHGCSMETFYRHCYKAKHTITLIEVLQTGGTIGMFATDTWHPNSKAYGNGPNPVCYNWEHGIPSWSDCEDNSENMAISEQFMVSNQQFISMGATTDGSNGLRIYEHLSKGSSAKSIGFSNAPLAGEEFPEFDVGIVEVYRLLRSIDGKAIDDVKDPWKYIFN